ncbi:MAG: ATP-dependent metallopeptidase FtsH/Yme1/Tma family protein, partial [Chloroflexi bacterium]|nr:ATP-dependent metallopeptidase FtsH/Yme1/Tma family protein [Chloroflexota bacterium]
MTRNTLIYLLIFVGIIVVFFVLFSRPLGGSEDVPISEIISLARNSELESIEVKGDDINAVTRDGERLSSRKETGSSIFELLQREGIDPATSNIEIIVKGSSGFSSFFGILINFLPLILFGAILIFMMRQAQG